MILIQSFSEITKVKEVPSIIEYPLIMEVNISAKVLASRSREQDGRAKQVLRKHTTIHF